MGVERGRQVHVYVTDASAPTMDNSDSVGWFTVDLRDLAGQRLRHERWVKVQGASPAEVLISSSLSIVAEDESDRDHPRGVGSRSQSVSRSSSSFSSSSSSPASPSSPRVQAARRLESGAEVVAAGPSLESRARPLAPSVVTELDALPVGEGALGADAGTFSLSVAIKGAARLLQLAPELEGVGGGGAGFWFSYSLFGVVVQTDRFESLAPCPSGGSLVEPMMDSFRLRATLPGLCDFLAGAPPLQVSLRSRSRCS